MTEFKKGRIGAIIQARMGSTRLPSKVLRLLAGRPMLAQIVERIRAVPAIDSIVLATTHLEEDRPLIQFAKEQQIDLFRGESDNVLSRYYHAAKKYEIENIVRITADDPFKDPKIIVKAIEQYQTSTADYVSNSVQATYPEGLDVEVFCFSALHKAFLEAKKAYEKEHVTPYIWENPQLFKCEQFHHTKDLSWMRWTVDTAADFEFAQEIYRQLYDPTRVFLFEEILALLRTQPELAKLMPKIERNAGLKKSKGES